MRSLRTLSSLILLGVMALVVVPRELLHACEHDALVHHAEEGSTSVDATCASCDLGLPIGTVVAPVELHMRTAVRCMEHAPDVRDTSLGFTALAADRGPPARC